jgi:hypothetical protein
MAWIRIEESTPNKPEIARLAQGLSVTLGDAFLEFVRLYLWADANVACPGFVPRMSLELLDQIARVRAGTCASLASTEIGWLKLADGGVQFVNWERHNGKSAKQRLYERERKSDYRNRGTNNGTNNGTNVPKKLGQKAPKRREEKRREEKGGNPLPLFRFPATLDTEAFREIWQEWTDYRKELRKPYTPRGKQAALAKLSTMGEARAIAALHYSMAQGWQGIFEPSCTARAKAERNREAEKKELEELANAPE